MAPLPERLALLVQAIFSITKVCDNWKTIPRTDVLLVGHAADISYTFRGKLYSTLLGSAAELYQERGLNCALVLKPYSVISRKQLWVVAYTYNRRAFGRLLFNQAIRLLGGNGQFAERRRRHEIQFWTELLKISRPKIIVAIQPPPMLCVAARAFGAEVFDLQHGVIADSHPWYGYRFREGTPPQELPNSFLVWDNASAAVLNKWAPQKGIAVTVTGNAWFHRFKEKRADDLLVEEALNSNKIFVDAKPCILVSLQWGLAQFHKEPGFNGFMVKALENYIKKTCTEFNWMLRLHPVQLHGSLRGSTERYLKRTFGHFPGVDWQQSSALPLPIVLAQTTVHITSSSTVVIEASWFQIKSALLNPELQKGGEIDTCFLEQQDDGTAELIAGTEADIDHWVRQNIEMANQGGNTHIFGSLAEVHEA